MALCFAGPGQRRVLFCVVPRAAPRSIRARHPVLSEFESCVLKNADIRAAAPAPYNNVTAYPFYRMERPKIFKCPATGKYAMWFHCDTRCARSRRVCNEVALTATCAGATACAPLSLLSRSANAHSALLARTHSLAVVYDTGPPSLPRLLTAASP